MDVERWERAKELFEAALEREEPERSAFLIEACQSDHEMRLEVESLLSGERNAGDFLQEPAARLAFTAPTNDNPPSTFSPGEIISGRFKVLRFIGRGGMGEVYEARDLDRDARVALKTIRPEIASDPKTLARFKQEIELALRVAHPNVCRVHDLERHRPPEGSGKSDVVFLTMELLEGETLADRLRRNGRMTCGEALPLIHQMAEGLAAAHKVGVIHCDFKPGNVMLVSERPVDVDSQQSTQSVDLAEIPPQGSAGANLRAVITDFGLARAMRPTVTRKTIQDSLNTDAQLVGTLPYMAPEQLEGCPATPATDVYALGLVIYEMVTGRQPFSGPTPLAAAYKRLKEPPPPPRPLAPDLDPGLESVILRCLERDPASRFRDARDMLAALGESSGRFVSKLRRIHRAPTWSAAIAISVVLIGAALLALSPHVLESLRVRLFARPIPGPKNLVVLPFKATDAPPEDRARCDGLTETVTAALVQAASLQVASAEFVREHHIDDIKGARDQFGANLALSASWQHVGESARINLSLVDTKTGQTLGSDTVDAAAGNVFKLQDQVVLHALRMLQVQLSKVQRKDLTTHGTEVLTAYDFYVRGIGYLQRYEKPENVDLAIGLFQSAIEDDRNYAQAQAALAQAYWYKYSATNDPQWADRAKAAVKSAESLDSGLPEVLVAVGDLKRRTGDYAGAVADFEQAVNLDRNDVDAYQRLGHAYDSLGRPKQAEQAFRQAIRLQPACWDCYDSLGVFLFKHARYEEALQAWQRIIDLSPDNVFGYMNVGVFYYQVGEFARAAEYFQRGLELDPNNPGLNADAGTVNFFLRRYPAAAQFTEKAVSLQPDDFTNRGNLADAYRAIPGQQQKARESYEQAIALAENSLRVNPNDADALSSLALYYARIGNRSASRSFLARALSIEPADVAVLRIACLVNLEAGDTQEALKWLEKAVKAGYPRGHLLANPELDRLRADPQFSRLASQAKTYN